MSLTRTLLSDRTGLLGATGGALAGLPPAAVYGYLLARLLIPVLLIILAACGATPTQKISLVRDYLIAHHPDRDRKTTADSPAGYETGLGKHYPG